MGDTAEGESAASGVGVGPDFRHGAAETAFLAALEERDASQGPVVFVVESSDGRAPTLVDLIPAELGEPVRGEGAEATRVRVGCLAEEMHLDDFQGGALVVENAQWADPTSLGRLQRTLKGAEGDVVAVISHRPVTDVDAWSIAQLKDAARRHATVIEIATEASEAPPVELPEDPRARDLVLGLGLVSHSLGVPILARFVGVSDSEALDLAESLSAGGFLRQTRAGFSAAERGVTTTAGEARLGHLAGRLADVLEEADRDRAVVGALRMAAGDPTAAFPHLAQAATAAAERGATGEAFHLARSALSAAAEGGTGDDAQLGSLHLLCGRHLRAAGRSDDAAEHLDRAVSLLAGSTRVDAMGFAAAVADDRQHPQDAERILAMAELEAIRSGEIAKLGSLGTFHARALNRIGFAPEADYLLEKSGILLEEHGTSTQRYFADVNRAWIAFDRGQVTRAEVEFTRLRDGTGTGDVAGLADKEAWRARALFACGRPEEAIEAVMAARSAAEQAEVEAPLFLADLGLAEGNLLFGRFDKALEAADRVLDLVERQLPAWQNVARCQRAAALAGLGRLDEAQAEILAALEATPAGANGWRWRSRCQAVQMEIRAVAGTGWDRQAAVDLADMLLQSELYGWAAELMCVIAEQSRDRDMAREAMALAHEVGNPMLAARAAHAGKLWSEAAAAPVIRAMRAVESQVPETWMAEWRALPAVESALAAPEPRADDGAENAAVLDRALRRVGLAGADVVLSPAQRRHQGLVRRRAPWRPWRVAAASLGVVALAAVTSLAVAQMGEDPAPVTIIQQSPQTTVAAALTLEETEIAFPDGVEQVFGTALDRGDPGRSGFVDVAGPRQVDGHYWVFQSAAAIDANPVAYGNNLLVGSTDGTFYALDQMTRRVAWTLPTEGRISAAPALATAELGEGTTAPLVIVVGDDGIVRARNAIVEVEDELWATPQLGTRIRSAPVAVEDKVFVATSDGVVYGLSIFTGEILWRYPAEDAEQPSLGAISAGLAFADGILYVGTQEGTLHLLDTEGSEICRAALSGAIVVNPMVVDGTAYIGTRGRVIHVLPAGVCETPPDQMRQLITETAVTVAPAIAGDVMYLPSGPFLYQIDLTTQAHVWDPSTVFADGDIASPPVVAGDTVYFGTENGTVYAVDAASGEALWEWQTGNFVRAAPVVVEGVVFIASGDGNVYAVGPEG